MGLVNGARGISLDECLFGGPHPVLPPDHAAASKVPGCFSSSLPSQWASVSNMIICFRQLPEKSPYPKVENSGGVYLTTPFSSTSWDSS